MIRTLLRTPTLARATPRAVVASRSVTTRAPTNSSGTPSTDIAGTLAPGEEVDPQLNGYPQLPYLSLQHREPFGWWDRQERKNFGEVVHEEEDALGMWSPDAHKIGGLTALFSILGAFTAVGVFGYFLTINRIESPVAKRSYPYGGLEKELGGRNAARIEEDSMDE